MNQNPASIPPSIRTAAADWFARLRNADQAPGTRQEFERWFRADPRHKLAFEQCRALWSMTSSLAQDSELGAELAQARARIATPNRPTERPWWHYPSRAAALLMLGLAFIFGANYQPTEDYSTRVGEQRLVQLIDGSKVLLNTNSHVRVTYSNKKRRIDLLQGEAYFEVAKNHQRPFEVIANGSLVRAVGTQFNVELLNQAINVDVTEGVVEFESATALNPEPEVLTRIKVGEAVRFHRGDAKAELVSANIARINAWQARNIYFNASPLVEAVAEFNRYIPERIILVDSKLNQQQISGLFHQGDLDSFIFTLEQALGARVERRDNKVLVMAGQH